MPAKVTLRNGMVEWDDIITYSHPLHGIHWYEWIGLSAGE
jgi:hypothetical protein